MSNLLTVLCNLIPLAGMMWLGWGAFNLLAMYWFENWVVMLFTLCGVAILYKRGAVRIAPREVSNVYAFYGVGGLMSGLLLFFGAPLFFGVPYDFWREPHMIWGVVGLSVSHAYVFLDDLSVGHPDRRRKSPGAIVNRAMKRVPPFVFAMVVGVLGFAALGSPWLGVVVLAVLKTAFEVRLLTPPVPPLDPAAK